MEYLPLSKDTACASSPIIPNPQNKTEQSRSKHSQNLKQCTSYLPTYLPILYARRETKTGTLQVRLMSSLGAFCAMTLTYIAATLLLLRLSICLEANPIRTLKRKASQRRSPGAGYRVLERRLGRFDVYKAGSGIQSLAHRPSEVQL